MRLPGLALLACLAALAVATAALPSPAEASFGAVPADSAAKKKRCKKSQVKVRVGKRISCRPLRKVLPKPRAGDPRKLFTQFVFKKDWSKFRNRRGKRPPSLPRLLGKVGRGGPALLTRATSRGLRRLDGMANEAAAARANARAAQTAAGCAAIRDAPRKSDSFTSGGGGGPRATVGVELGPDGATMGIDVTGNGVTVSVDIDMGLCDPNEVEAPGCPTAVGRLPGEIRYKFKVAIQVTKGGTDVWSQAMEVTRKTKLVGWNEVDAKLDRLDIDDLETSTFRLGGTTRDFPPITMRTRLERNTQVDMRSGDYEPGRSNVEVTLQMEGLFGPDREEAEADAERKAREDGDRQFRAVVEKAISGYRFREEAWQVPSPAKCAELKVTPASNTLTLSGGSTGSFSATAIAKTDGSPSELDARLSDMQNAAFSPTRAGGQHAQFSYSDVVPSAPPGSKVVVKVHATSKAGVAEATWEQPLRPPFEINKIAGNFSGSYTVPTGGGRTGVVSWTGSATFERTTPPGFPGASGSYALKAGSVSIHFSGGSIVGDALCDMSGSTFVDLFQDAGGSIGVNPVNPAKLFEQGPHNYSGNVSLGFGPEVDLTESSCAAAEHNGTVHSDYPVGAIQVLDTGPDELQSPDGIHYNGTYSDSNGGVTTQTTWVLTGAKDPS
jgi:hypothetical protein